jgi:hypothetical protein
LLKKNSGGEDEDDKPSFHVIPPMSIKNEVKVLNEIEKLAEQALGNYTNGYEVMLNLMF